MNQFPIRYLRWLAMLIVAVVPVAASAQPAGAEAPATLPPVLHGVGVDQKLNQQIPADIVVRDESGHDVALGSFFDGRRPIVLTLVYYGCPNLCTLVLNDTLRSLRAIPISIGDDFQVLTVSFDPRETSELAAAKKKQYVAEYGRPSGAAGWHFLTADQANVERLTDAVGYRYKWDPLSGQYAHPSAIMVLTPQGKVARYFFGLGYEPKDVRLALVEASNDKIGSVTDQILLYCFHYDPATGKYGLVVVRALRVGAVAIVLGLGSILFFMFRRERRAAKRTSSSPPSSLAS